MAAYADLVSSDAYQSKMAGAAVGVQLINARDPSDVVIGAATSLSSSEQYEQVAVEEAGNDGVDEFVEGRHAGSGSLSGFWTPEWGDNVPRRQDFIDREFVILKTIAPNRVRDGDNLAGIVVEAFVGVKINAVSNQQGARGAVMLDIGFVFSRRYSGAEWAALSGG